ncbi:MAG: redox-sensing transcriptional repressor Rex [Oscillospiraceae bacterium]|nr:redox-sensing transcriptional repressor Rex [Oscillospiraceae bacterium]
MSDNTNRKVPSVVIKRLPRYYRYFGELLNQGIKRISSNALSEKMGVTASQIRQDFNYFGGFGQQGYGYKVEYLYNTIGDILGLHEGYTTIIVGAGNLGRALANHNFAKRGFRLMGMFDIDERIIGSKVNNVEIYHIDMMESFVRENNIDVGILTVPKSEIESIADRLCACGIKGLWNYSYAELKPKNNIPIENVHLSDSLMTLSYKIKQKE